MLQSESETAEEPAPKGGGRSRRASLITLGLGLLLVALLVAGLPDKSRLRETLTGTEPVLVLAALGAYALSYLFRALRFRLLLHSARPPLGELYAVVSVHNLFNMLLPARTGELSFVYLAGRRFGTSRGEGLATLLVARLYDSLGIAVFFLVALLSRASAEAGERADLRLAGAALVALTLLLLLALVPGAALTHRAGERLLARAGVGDRLLVRRVLEKLGSLVRHLQVIRARRTAPWVFLVTECQWFFTFVTCYALLRACPGVPAFPFGASVLGSTGLSVALILPVNPPANVGSFEAGWYAGYVLAGLSGELATLTAIAAHVWILSFAAALGLLGRLALRKAR